MSQVRLAGIIKESIVDGPGIRFVVFAQGCPHRCKGCHNPQTFSATGGYISDTDYILDEMRANPLISGVTFSGGEPFLQAKSFLELAKKSHELGLNVMTYTGYTFEHIISNFDCVPYWKEFMANIDILVDGPFEIDKKNPLLKFRGSENQRIIDVKRSLIKGCAITLKLQENYELA